MNRSIITTAAVAFVFALVVFFIRFSAQTPLLRDKERVVNNDPDQKRGNQFSGDSVKDGMNAGKAGDNRGLTMQDRRDGADRQKREAAGFKTSPINLEKVKFPHDGTAKMPYPDGRMESSNRDGSLILQRRGESYYVNDVDKGSMLKLPFEYGLDPENGLHGEQSISWQWLDENRIIGVQEAWRESDPNPLASPEFLSSGLSESEMSVAMPTCSFLFLYDTRVPGVIYRINPPPLPAGYAVRLDAILPEGIIELSACTPLGYYGDVGESQKSGIRHPPTILIGQFEIRH